MKQLSWADFDACVQVLTQRYGGRSFDGVFGIPRGGLCLAVGLSHSLDLPLLPAPNNHCLIVDDDSVSYTHLTLPTNREV